MKQLEIPKEFQSRNGPDAIAIIKAKEDTQLKGCVLFWQKGNDVLISTHVQHLPMPSRNRCNQPIFAFHIHEGVNCADPKGHYNPHHCDHPYHAGDLPPLLSLKNGEAYLSFKTDRFKLSDVIGKVIVIHQHADDFTSQPSGDPGSIIACGKIRAKKKHLT